MNRQEKANLVMSLANTISTKIIAEIDENKIPEDWEGKELRALFALLAEAQTFSMARRQRMNFRNTVNVNNLV